MHPYAAEDPLGPWEDMRSNGHENNETMTKTCIYRQNCGAMGWLVVLRCPGNFWLGSKVDETIHWRSRYKLQIPGVPASNARRLARLRRETKHRFYCTNPAMWKPYLDSSLKKNLRCIVYGSWQRAQLSWLGNHVDSPSWLIYTSCRAWIQFIQEYLNLSGRIHIWNYQPDLQWSDQILHIVYSLLS